MVALFVHCCCICIAAFSFLSLCVFPFLCIVVQLGRMAKESFSTHTLKEDADTLATLEPLSSEELQRRLEKIINMLSIDNNKDVSDFASWGGDRDLRRYDPLDKSTYTFPRPQFLRYRPGRMDDDEGLEDKYEGMERSHRSSCFKNKILILVAVLFVFIFCISAWHSSKFYAGLKLQAFNEYADGFGLPMREIVEDLDLSINKCANELGFFINKDLGEHSLPINGNIEKFSMGIDEDETHGLAVLKQFGTLESCQSKTLALENPNQIETMMLEGKKAKDWVLDVLVAENSKHLEMLDVLVSEDSKHLRVLDVLVTEDCKHLGAVPSSIPVKSVRSPLLYGVTGAFFCAAAIVLNWYTKRATYACPRTSLEAVKEIQTKNTHAEQGPLKQMLKLQAKDSCVPSVQLLNEYSLVQTVSSSGKKKDIMWDDSNIGRNSFYIPNQEVQRKGDSTSTTNQENMAAGEIYMENSFYGSLTMMTNKDKQKERQKLIPARRSDWACNPTKSDSFLYKEYVDKKKLKEMPVRRLDRIQNPKASDCALYKDADKKQQKEIPLRRSERIRNLTKSDCARRQHA